MDKSSYQRIRGNFSSHSCNMNCAYLRFTDRIIFIACRIKGNSISLPGQEYKGIGQNTYIPYPIKISLHILPPIFCEYREQKYVVMLDALTLLVDTLGVGLPTNNVNQYLAESNNSHSLDDCKNYLPSASRNPCWTQDFGRASPPVKLQNLDDFSIQQFTQRPPLAALDSPRWGLRCCLSGPEPLATQQPDLVAKPSLDVISQHGESSAACQPPSTGAAWISDLALGAKSLLSAWEPRARRGFRWGENFIRSWTNTNETGAAPCDLGIAMNLSAVWPPIPAGFAPERRSEHRANRQPRRAIHGHF